MTPRVFRMGETSSGLNKKSAVGWDGWILYVSSEVDCLCGTIFCVIILINAAVVSLFSPLKPVRFPALRACG